MTANGSPHLGATLAARPLHLFWLLDVSGSMAVGGKIEALNEAMSTAVTAVRQAADENPGVQVLARVVTFAHDATWHVPVPTDIFDFVWEPVSVVERGTTELGRALGVVTEAIREVAREGRGLPPALVLVSDGKPTDLKQPSFGRSLRELAQEPWGRKASRIAIGIGGDADMAALARFIGHDELPPIRADNADELVHYLRWASTIAVDDRSRPAMAWDVSDELGVMPDAMDPSDQATHPSLGAPVATEEPTVPVEEPTVMETSEEPTSTVEPAAPPPPPAGRPRLDIPPPPVRSDEDSGKW